MVIILQVTAISVKHQLRVLRRAVSQTDATLSNWLS